MRRFDLVGSFLLAGGGLPFACSSSAPEVVPAADAGVGGSAAAGGGGSSSGGGAAMSSGNGGSSGGSGGGMSTDGGSDTSVVDAAAGQGGAPADAAKSGDAALATGPFTCTEVIGLGITNEWWSAGFLTDGVDPTKFEIKWHHQGYVQSWANSNSPFWLNQGDPQNNAEGAPIQSPCARGSTTPDRILFVAVDFDIVTEDAWVTALNGVVAAIKTKYAPTLKRLELTTLIRCPNDKMCNPSANYGPGANIDVPREDCYVPPYWDSAIGKVIAAQPDLVGLGPEPQATMCLTPVNGPHLSAASNAAAAKAMAAYYVQHP
jgi:hypothetical protein